MALTKVSYAMTNGSPANVLDFGAIGDGVADDTAAIQAAIDTGNAVYIPDGIYKTTTALALNNAGQSLFGQSRNAILSFQPTIAANGILCSAFDLTISTLTFNLNANTVRAIAITTPGQRGTIYNCFFEGTNPITTNQIGVYGDGQSIAVYLWKINNCDFAFLDVGIYMQGPDANAWHIDKVNFGEVNQGIVLNNVVLNTISNVFHQTPNTCVINFQSGALYNSLTNIIGESNIAPLIILAGNVRFNRIFGVTNSGSSALIDDNTTAATDTNYLHTGELGKIMPTPAVTTIAAYNNYGTKVSVTISVGATPANIVKNSQFVCTLTSSSITIPLNGGESISVSQLVGVTWDWWKD
jgi:hypothetical protein